MGRGPLCRRWGRNQRRGFKAEGEGEEQARLAAVSSPEKMFNPQKDLRSKTNGAIYHPLRLVGRSVTGRMRMFTGSDHKAEALPDALFVPDRRQMAMLPPLPYAIVRLISWC